MLGKKLGARICLWMSEFTDGTTAGLSELSISCPKLVPEVDVDAGGGGAA